VSQHIYKSQSNNVHRAADYVMSVLQSPQSRELLQATKGAGGIVASTLGKIVPAFGSREQTISDSSSCFFISGTERPKCCLLSFWSNIPQIHSLL
jgi:hypothetical protein